MNTTVKVISVDGDVWRFSNTNKKLILKKGAKLQAKDVLHLSEESNVVLQLSNGRVVEIHGKDLINNDGNFSLNSLLVESNSDIDKIVNFAKSFQQMNESEQQNDVVRLDDGRVFKKEGKDYVEIAGESFEGDPDVTQGGHRFVQLTRAGETSVADGIKPLMLNRVVDNIPPLGIQYPILSSVIKPFEHGLGGGSWMPLSVSTLTGNTPPVAVNDSYTTPHNTPVVLNPLQGDTDPENDALSITSINGVTLTPGTAQSIPVTNGVVTVAADGTITFTPNTGFVGQVSFPYTISDGHGGTSQAIETITITNTAPAAVNDNYTTPHNTPVVLNPLQGDTDPENDALSITSINGVTLTPGTAQSIPVTNGVVTVAADGTITFTPNTGFVGQVSFPYTISDGHGGTSQAIETITITNTAPAAVNDNYTTPHNTPVVLNPLQGDTDPENDALSITSINGVTLTPGTAQSIPVTNGVVTVAADGTITFTPNTGFVGQVSFPYTISDGHGGTSQAIETITITNTAPAAVNDNYTTPHNTPVVLNPLQGDTDPENDALSITSINGVTLTPGTAQSIPVTNGVVTVAADGTITFTPNTGFVGQVSFPYTISDGHGGTSQAIETITITNTAPAAVNDNYTTPHNTPVVLNPLQGDTDPENDALSITSINGVTLTPGTAQSIPVTNGVVTVAADGTITFTPNTGFVGQVSFPYTISDGHGGTSQAIETITITNTAPAAVNDNYTTPHNTPVVLNPLQGDTDPENDALSITSINGVTLTPGTAQSIPVTNGVVTVAADGTITFTPNTGFVGQVSFPYTISDGHGGTSQAIETITITNTAPAAVNDNYTTPHNTPVVLNPLQGDTDPENDALSITSINGVTLTPGTAQSIPVTNGVVTVAADGTITFTPNTGFVGQVSFPYTISDGHGGTSQAIETITITNTAPAAVNDNYTTPHNTPVVLNPLQGDTDPENDALSITSINGVTLTPGTAQSIPVTNGVVTVAADGTITFTPNTGFVGQVSFPYTISDGHGGTSQAIETITITNTAPELTSGSARVSEEGLVGGLADSNGDDLTNSRTFNGTLQGADVDSDAVLTYAFTAAPSDVLTANGVTVVWTLVSATEVVGTANGNPVVSVILDSATGDYTVTLDKAVDHADMTQEDILDFTIPTRVTDNHGASATSTLNVIVEDDSPVITPTNTANSLQVDETNFVSGSVSVTDNNFGTSAFTVNYGADDAAVSNSLLYSLGVSAVEVSSGLIDTATNQLVYLYIDSGTGDVIGRVGSGGNPAPLGAEAFRIHVDASTGSTTLTQNRPLNHLVDGPTPSNHNDALNMTANLIRLNATATDKDGDVVTQGTDIGDKFSFLDDGPVFVSSTTATVDEADLPLGSSPTPSALTQSGTLMINFGADKGTASQVDVQFTAATLTALENWDNTATGGEANNENLTFAISNAGHTITATDSVSGLPAFTVTLTVDKATGATSYEFVLSRALAHNNLPELHIPFNDLQIIDGDGDTVSGNFVVRVIDDSPDTLVPINVSVYEDLYIPNGNLATNTFNTNADATSANTVVNNGVGGSPSVVTNVTVYVNGTAQVLPTAYETPHGYVVVQTNGQITYYPDPDFSGVDSFTYTTTTDDGAKTYTVNMTVTPVSNDHPEMGSNPDPVPANNIRCTNEDTRVDLNLVAPVIKDRTDQNGATTGDNPERLGAITLTLTGLGAASNAPPAGVGVQHTNNGATLTKADGTPLVTNGSGGYTIVIVDTAGSTTPSASYHHAGVPAGAANVNYMTAAEYADINANPGLHRHENFNVNVSVTSYEVDATTGQVRTDVWGVRADGANADDALGVGATSTETITVTVRAVTDDASLGYNNNASGTAATGSSHTGGTDPTTYSVVYSTHTEGSNLNRPAAAVTLGEDKAINIKDILTANFADLDGSENRTLTLENPAGSGGTIRYSVDGGTTWLPLASGAAPVTVRIAKTGVDGQSGTISSFDDIRIAAPQNFAGDIGNTNKIKITIGAGDTDSDGAACGVPIAEADTTNNSVYLSLHVNPRAGDVRTSTVATIEDTPVAFLANIAVTDSSEVINSVSFTIPTGWRVLDPTSITTNADAGAGGNGWTANPVTGAGWSASQLGSTYTITFTDNSLTQGDRDLILDQFKILPPAHSSKDLTGSNLVLTINVTDSATVNGAPVSDTVNRTLNQTITVSPVAESLKLTGNAIVTNSTTDYYATAADNPANWIVRNTDGTAANANVDGGGTQDLTMNGNWNYDTHALEDTWFALNSDGFNFKGPWHNEDANTADINNPSSRVEQTFALLTAYEVVRNASGVIIGLNALPASEFQYNNGSVVTGNRIPAANLDTVSFKAPNGFSGEVWIKVQAVTVDYDADNGSASAEVTSGVAWLKDLLVEPVADDVTLQVNQREVMDEDTSRALTIRTQSTDTDTSETFNVKIAGIPLGAKMELGGHVFDTTVPSTWTHAGHTLVNNGGGSFTLELNGLPQGTINPIYTPPLHSNTNGTDTVLTVNAQAVDSKVIWDANALPPAFVTYTSTSPISSNQTIAISVIGVPDAPMLTIVQHQTWIENNLDEHNGGTNNATSSTQKNVVDLSNFITGISYGESTHPSHGGTDNSETITLRITGLPNGFDLVDAAGGPIVTLGGGNGTDRVWVITPADLATAKIKLPVNYSGTVKFDVEPVVTENDGRATIFAKQNVEFYVTPSPEATLNIESNVWEDVDNGTYGHAGQLGKLDLIANTVVNGDNLNEQIYAVRFNATQLAAEGITLYANAAGTTQLVAVGGFITVTGVTNVQSIYVRGPANFSGSKAITVEYIVADSTNDGTLGANQTIYTGGTNTLNWATHETINHTLNFRPVTDNVDMNINNINGGAVTNYTLNAAGTVTVNLGIAKAQDANAGNARDYDYTVANGGEHITHYLIEGVPEQGVSVQGAIYLGGGKWLMAASGENFTGSLTKNVIFNVNNHAGDINNHPITITTYTQDKNASVVTDSVTWNLTTNFPDGGIEPILPTLDIVPLNPNETEDTAFALSKAIALNSINFGSVNQPSYDLTITLRTYPGDNTSFSIGGTPLTSTVVIEGGVPVTVWTYTVSGVTNANAQAAVQYALNNILVTPATNANGNTNNLNDTLPLDVSVQFHSSGVTSGDRTTSEVTLAPVTDPAVLTITAPATDEGGIVPITINVGSAGGADKTGDWTIIGNNLYLQFSGTVIDGQLQDSLGNPIATVTNPAGLPAGTYYVVTGVTPNTPVQLRYAIEQDDSRYDHGSFTLNGWVRNQENGSTPLVSNGSAPIVINPVNSDPVITVVAHDDEHNGQGANAIGAVELNITKTVMPNDPQVGEQLYSAFIKGLPNGFLVYYGADQNSATLATNAGDGTWVIPVSGNDLPPYISIKPPAYWSGTLDDLQLVLMSGETGLTATPHAIDFDLVVDPVANGISDFKPTYSFNQTGNTFTTLNLNIGMNDPVRVNNSAYDENAELTRLTLAGIPNAADSIFIANGAVIDASRITTVGSTITINGLTQAELDNLQLIHAPMARTQITANAQTYEVDAAGNTVDTSGWFGTRTFDLQITAGPTTGSGNLTGTAGNDTLIATGSSNTTLTGSAGHDILIGNAGNNILNGGDDNDRLYGQGGNDTLNGGNGNDILYGGKGNDTLWGNAGADTFAWAAGDIGTTASPDTDTIKDFDKIAGDKINAKALLDSLGWNGNMATLSDYVSVVGSNTINIHDATNTVHSVNIVVEGQTFTDLNDMITKTNFQTT